MASSYDALPSLPLNRSTRPLSRPRIRSRTLTTQRQSAPVTNTAVTTEVHQALDIHRDVAAKITLNLKVRDCGAQLRNFRLSEIFDFGCRINACRSATLSRARSADTVNRRQCDHDVLVQRYVYACYTCHSISSIRALPLFRRPLRLTLALLVPRVGADHPHNSVATNDFAVSADFLY